jgi:hypothetical protein
MLDGRFNRLLLVKSDRRLAKLMSTVVGPQARQAPAPAGEPPPMDALPDVLALARQRRYLHCHNNKKTGACIRILLEPLECPIDPCEYPSFAWP